jgi:hypothetical protein
MLLRISPSVLTMCMAACTATGTDRTTNEAVPRTFFAPTQENVDAANRICENQVQTDRNNYEKTWFTNWLKCKQAHVMPLEVRLYPGKEREIHNMYVELLHLGEKVDAGESIVEPVYDAWDRMQADIGMYKGVCVKNADGSQDCRSEGDSTIFLHTKEGRVIPLN